MGAGADGAVDASAPAARTAGETRAYRCPASAPLQVWTSLGTGSRCYSVGPTTRPRYRRCEKTSDQSLDFAHAPSRGAVPGHGSWHGSLGAAVGPTYWYRASQQLAGDRGGRDDYTS